MNVLTKLKDALTGPTPDEVRENYQRAERLCPNCGSDDYWFSTDRGPLTVHRCLDCRSEGIGPGGFNR